MSALRLVGHILAIAWAGFWIVSGAWSGYRETGSLLTAAGYALAPGGLFALIAAVVWRWEHVGAWAILLCGLAIVGHGARQPDTTWPMILLAGPPMAGGLLLLVYHHLEAKVRRFTTSTTAR